MEIFFVEISAERALNRKEAYPLILEKAGVDAKDKGIKSFFIQNYYPNGGPFTKKFYWKARVVEVEVKIGEVI